MVEKNLRKNFIMNSLLVLSIFLFDRLSKIYVIYLDKKFLGSEIFSSKFLNITLIWNEGIAFGFFSFDEKYYYNILTLIISLIIIGILIFTLRSKGTQKYVLLIILGGAIGNFFDRVFNKAVPDFIDFHIGDFHWFIFNTADVFISLGVIFMIFLEFTDNNNRANKS